MTTTAQQLHAGESSASPGNPIVRSESPGMESHGGNQACERALFTLAGNQAAHERTGDQRDDSDLPGSFCRHSPSAVSAANDSEGDVHGDGHCGSAARYSRAAETQASGSSQSSEGAASASGGEASAAKAECCKILCAAKIVAPKPKPRQVEAELPKVNDTFQPLNLKVDTSQPARPREPVKTGLMSGGSSAVPTITKPTPVEKVQTGGFGDPNGVAGPSDPNKRANIGQFGNPALPPGPGYGNGTGGANGQRGIVASTGFGNGVAIPPTGGAKRSGPVQTAGFANQTIKSPKRQRRKWTTPRPLSRS